ncbi:response regulator [Chryseolinea sp. H1M3-3]|jgi:response regulator RpfG family c-di-GMP phosphodiesterase|uniref:response regulator n=1 Tax=Chryseolinea sp. H1M3-3 TaxID=3034144 RepID=UPI0023ECFE27|nr:response regulator [Chryseolinea sp. H1M3-3]
MKPPFQFILIDDDPMNNLICKLTIEMTFGQSDVKAFVNPEVALNYIQTDFANLPDTTGLLLLDINMPIMSGWEFLEMFDNLRFDLKERIKICILSSSIDERDKERSYANKNVLDFLVKPLTDKDVQRITSMELKKGKSL